MAVAGRFGGRGGGCTVADINTAGRESLSSEIVRPIGILLYGYGNALLTINCLRFMADKYGHIGLDGIVSDSAVRLLVRDSLCRGRCRHLQCLLKVLPFVLTKVLTSLQISVMTLVFNSQHYDSCQNLIMR